MVSPAQEQQIAHSVERFLSSDAAPLSDYDRVVSRLLHDRLSSYFDASQWPVQRLLDCLKTLYEPVSQADTTPDTEPTTPPLSSTCVIAHPPAQHQSPRSSRAKSCVSGLRQLKCWPDLIAHHNFIWNVIDKTRIFKPNVEIFASSILDESIWKQLVAHIPELEDAAGRPTQFVSALASAYSHLHTSTASFDSEHDCLALVLVHAVVSLPVSPRTAEVADSNDHFASQFGRTYRGDAHRRFLDFVSQLDHDYDQLDKTDRKPYYRGTPIVQSSGTGKTRMVLECRHLTPLLYVCFRSNDAVANAKAGFPFPDNGVVPFFTKAHQSHPGLCNLHVACFLGAWFQQLAQKLDECPTDQDKLCRLLDLNRLDQSYGENKQRLELFADICEQAKLLIGRAPGNLLKEKQYQEIFQHYIYPPYTYLQQQVSRISLHMQSLRHQTGSATRAPPVIVAVDECVEMNVVGENGGNNPLNSLRRAWCYLSDVQARQRDTTFWLVLMSTSSSAADLVEHIDAQTSIRSKDAVPLPTFVGVGFDTLVTEQQSLCRASEAFMKEHIITYGRPLWSSLEKRGFWDFVKDKLTGGKAFSIEDAAHCFSILASRLALSLVPTYSSSSPLFAKQKVFMDMAVDRHMRIVNHITDEAAMYIHSPSEPVLAIAASLCMLSSPFQGELSIIKDSSQPIGDRYGPILENFWRQCLLDPVISSLKGTYGELASRLALMVACDAAKRQRINDLEPGHTGSLDLAASIISQAVPLETVLAGLADLDQGHFAQLRQRIRNVYDGGWRKGLFAMSRQGGVTDETPPAYIHFTHFDVLPNEIMEITPEYLWYCWKRGVALQMAHDQHGIDGIIPVFMGRLDQPFAEADANDSVDGDSGASRLEKHAARYMTYVAWEAKNQAAPQTTECDPFKAAKLAGPRLLRPSVTPSEQEPLTQRALINVLLDLGTKSSFSNAPRGLRPRLQPITGQDCPRLSIRGVLDKHAYPCLDFFQIRPIFLKILTADLTSHGHGHLNTVLNPVWNQQVQPSLPSVSGAFTDQEQRQTSEITMDLD
ncbi:hypothetical protein EX895_001086 [Sporisorium graminicola]|uniref:Uncharacterized protein n=1 Tax=Sporisorium graminicola TaxID=280036 RepID=A0A4V6EUI5_9BASI|nr:hypothetical protein EX895_001086 [Sporisorium graminicola]TKY89789.1 hypothetical protein EX895_001086 [Sporisorium graminicola]